MTIGRVTVSTGANYLADVSETTYVLILELPLPGGKAIYEVPITKAFKDNLETAATLVKK